MYVQCNSIVCKPFQILPISSRASKEQYNTRNNLRDKIIETLRPGKIRFCNCWTYAITCNPAFKIWATPEFTR